MDHKDTVVHEVEVPTTEQVDAPTEQQEQPDIVQGVPTHSIAEHIPLTPTVEDTSPNAPNVKYLFCKVSLTVEAKRNTQPIVYTKCFELKVMYWSVRNRR